MRSDLIKVKEKTFSLADVVEDTEVKVGEVVEAEEEYEDEDESTFGMALHYLVETLKQLDIVIDEEQGDCTFETLNNLVELRLKIWDFIKENVEFREEKEKFIKQLEHFTDEQDKRNQERLEAFKHVRSDN